MEVSNHSFSRIQNEKKLLHNILGAEDLGEVLLVSGVRDAYYQVQAGDNASGLTSALRLH